VGPPNDSVQLVKITPMSLWFVVPITIVFMGLLLTIKHHWGGPTLYKHLGKLEYVTNLKCWVISMVIIMVISLYIINH
jgi:hypothetical protein